LKLLFHRNNYVCFITGTIDWKPQKDYSQEKYLEMEREENYKSEYFRGEIFAMESTSGYGSLKC